MTVSTPSIHERLARATGRKTCLISLLKPGIALDLLQHIENGTLKAPIQPRPVEEWDQMRSFGRKTRLAFEQLGWIDTSFEKTFAGLPRSTIRVLLGLGCRTRESVAEAIRSGTLCPENRNPGRGGPVLVELKPRVFATLSAWAGIEEPKEHPLAKTAIARSRSLANTLAMIERTQPSAVSEKLLREIAELRQRIQAVERTTAKVAIAAA